MSDLPTELERMLGPMDRGWPLGEGAGAVQVVRFRTRQGLTPFSTLGLSRHLLGAGDSPPIRQELMVETESTSMWPRNALAAIAEQCLARHEALVPASLVTLGSIDGTGMEVVLAFWTTELPTSPDPVQLMSLLYRARWPGSRPMAAASASATTSALWWPPGRWTRTGAAT